LSEQPTRRSQSEGQPDIPQPQEPEVRRGASESEFTQMSARTDEPRRYEYAIPELDNTLPGLRPDQASLPNSNPARNLGGPTIPSPVYTPPPAPIPPNPYVAGYAVPGGAPAHPRARARRRGFNWLFVGLAVFLISTTLALSLGAFVILRTPQVIVAQATATSTAQSKTTAPPGPSATPAPTATIGLGIQPWDGTHRLTILMMGLDKRPGEAGTAFRTDSMMVISIDPTAKSIGVLSIPRDMFVEIPTDTVVRNSYGLQRINAAYVIGELARPGYGAQLAVQATQYNLGIRINNYVVYEFTAVINGIDDLGGLDINVPTTINDPAYPNMYDGYDPLYIPAGMIHMNGTLALKYARTRHQTDDLDRARRQQQILMAARAKILNLNLLPQLVLRAPDLWNQLSTGLHTDLSLSQLLSLAVYMKDIPTQNIHQGVIDWSYLTGLNYNGQDVLIPQRAKIGPLLEQIFGANYN